MGRSIQNWAFVAPKMSRDLSEYFEGILDFIKDDPSIFLHAFTFADSDIGTIADMDGVISYTVPPPDVMSVFRKSRPPVVAITMCKPTARDIAFHLNVSIRKIENDFSSIYKHTLRDEIAAQRLDILCHALRSSNEPIKTLVARSGFGDMSQATRVFKAKFGLTMNQFRNARFPEGRP